MIKLSSIRAALATPLVLLTLLLALLPFAPARAADDFLDPDQAFVLSVRVLDAKRLELSYFWRIDGKDIGKAGDRILAQNVAPETLVQLRPRLDRINALYDSVEPGDRYALTYVPGLGTELALNGQSKGVIPGADFAAAYFRIWLGERPIDTALRDRLLACGNPSVARENTGAVRTDTR